MLIELQGIGKDYVVRKKIPGHPLKREKTVIHALSDISFSIGQGEIVGYIGPNGAGKSTTIKIMSGILTPDRGTCRIMGRVPHKQRKEHVRHIGVVFGQRSSLWWDVPVIDSFNLLKDIFELDDRRYKQTLHSIVEMMNLGDIINTPARQLSLGQRMRCEVAAALLHEPDILFLDEPTIGLDAVSKLAVREFIHTLNKERKVTVLLTTHDMSDIEALASRVMMIGKGSLLFDGSLDEIKQRHTKEKALHLRFEGRAPHICLEGAALLVDEPGHIAYSFNSAKLSPQALIAALATAEHANITDISVEEPPIEKIIASMYQEMQI